VSPNLTAHPVAHPHVSGREEAEAEEAAMLQRERLKQKKQKKKQARKAASASNHFDLKVLATTTKMGEKNQDAEDFMKSRMFGAAKHRVSAASSVRKKGGAAASVFRRR
jgi:hypothetical protein